MKLDDIDKKLDKVISLLEVHNPTEKVELSNCCGATLFLVNGDEGTNYYVCASCDRPCDVSTPTESKEKVYEPEISVPSTPSRSEVKIEDLLKDLDLYKHNSVLLNETIDKIINYFNQL